MADESTAPPPTPDLEGRSPKLLRLADGRSLKMRLDQRAAFRVQRETGRSIYAHTDAVTANARYVTGADGKPLIDTTSVDMSEVVELALYLTATDRSKRGLDEMTLEEFFDLLPAPDLAMQAKLMADVLATIYGSIFSGEAKASGNESTPAGATPATLASPAETPTPDGSTGPDASISAE